MNCQLSTVNCLIIGYGNTLRCDDGAGQWIAERVQEWDLDYVQSLPIHQLTPELAAPISQAQTVIFVDAFPVTKDNPAEVQIKTIVPETKANLWGHSFNPQFLLSLSQSLYGQVPQAYWVLIPAVNFEFGEEFSLITKNALESALQEIKKMLN